MNRDSVLSVYSDARAEYTKQLCVFLVPAYFQFFTDLFEKSKISSEPKKALWQFQNHLNEIHDWNMEKVNNEINIINNNCGCDYMEDLLTAVFIAHTKVLTAIRLSSNNKKIEINIPKIEHFLFKVLCETSKILWGSIYLFRDGISGIEKQQNYRNIEQLINEGILQAIRSLVPVKSILKDFVNNEEDQDDEIEPKESDQSVTISEAKAEPKAEPKVELTVEPKVELTVEPTVEPIVEPTVELKADSKEEPKEEPKEDSKELPARNQTIIINDKPNVKFAKFNTLFDSDNPMESDMVYDSEVSIPDLDIMTGDSSLLSVCDFDNLDDTNPSDIIQSDEYEVLV